MLKCTRKGCGNDYEESSNTDTSCHYHSGAPVFHEGLKSWSCCSDVNKPVLDFESFMTIPGCAIGSHSQDKPRPEAPTSSNGVSSGSTLRMDTNLDGQEIYSTAGSATVPSVATAVTKPAVPTPRVAYVEEEDDITVSIPVGTSCRRHGCDTKFVSDEDNRGHGESSVCIYHPAEPIFHEGSKGYRCCKRRVLEFEEFLRIKGCKTGRHLFSPKKTENGSTEELVDCRIDHYQTPAQIHVSVFAKKTDQNASSVRFEDSKVYLDLVMPASKRFKRTLDLYGPIIPTASKCTFFGTKVELVLAKADVRSWALLEETPHVNPNYNLTFGVGGRTGTVGAKAQVLDTENKARSG